MRACCKIESSATTDGYTVWPWPSSIADGNQRTYYGINGWKFCLVLFFDWKYIYVGQYVMHIACGTDSDVCFYFYRDCKNLKKKTTKISQQNIILSREFNKFSNQIKCFFSIFERPQLEDLLKWTKNMFEKYLLALHWDVDADSM